MVAHGVALSLYRDCFLDLRLFNSPDLRAWCSATAAKRGPLKQSWAEIQHSRDDEPLGGMMQMRNVRVNGFFFLTCAPRRSIVLQFFWSARKCL